MGDETGADPKHGRPPEPRGLDRLLRYFLWLGATGFGGPIATVGYMQRDLVEKRRWIDREDFLDGVALGEMTPGPLAAQVAMWTGYLQDGSRGALLVALAFIAPSFLMVLGISFLYVRYQGHGLVQALFYGVGPAVIAIVAIAAGKLARITDRRDWRLWVISAVVMAITAATGAEVALLFVGAGLLMLLVEQGRNLRLPVAVLATTTAAAMPALADPSVLLALGLFFLKAGAFIFGSGLAVVPFLHEGVVAQNHWLTERQFLDAVAVGIITPGPVVITAAFIGYLVAGLPGAIVSCIGIFTPIYAGVVLVGRWFVRHKDDRRVRAVVEGVTAAAAGAIAGAAIVIARQAIVDAPTLVIGLISLGVLAATREKEPFVVLAAGLVGVVLRH